VVTSSTINYINFGKPTGHMSLHLSNLSFKKYMFQVCIVRSQTQAMEFSLVLGVYMIVDQIEIWKFVYVVGCCLWPSGQSSWLQIRRAGFDSWHYQKKK
jgi:hypothetical protein